MEGTAGSHPSTLYIIRIKQPSVNGKKPDSDRNQQNRDEPAARPAAVIYICATSADFS